MFRDVSGWECADWFAPEGTKPQVGELSWGKHRALQFHSPKLKF